jgi:hypothetical protein
MRHRVAASLGALTLAVLGVACGHPEKSVIEQYFNALRAGDQQTLSSFAAFTFDKKPERWVIKGTIDEQKVPAVLPDLVQKAADAEKAMAENKKQAQLHYNDNYLLVEQVKEAQKKGAAIPAKLQPVATKWNEFQNKGRDLMKTVAQTKDAVEREKRAVQKSVGQMDDLLTLPGEMIEKKVEVDLTIGGQTQPYVMTLRKYELKRETGPKVTSRWVITSLQPKA